MIRMFTAAAAVALLAAPALAQEVSAGGQAARDQGQVAPPTQRSESEAMGQEAQERIPSPGGLEDQTAEMPGEDGGVAAIPGGEDVPAPGGGLGQDQWLDQNQGGQPTEGSLPPIEDDQTAAVPGEDADRLPGLGEQGAVATPDQEEAVDQERDLLRPGEVPVP